VFYWVFAKIAKPALRGDILSPATATTSATAIEVQRPWGIHSSVMSNLIFVTNVGLFVVWRPQGLSYAIPTFFVGAA